MSLDITKSILANPRIKDEDIVKRLYDVVTDMYDNRDFEDEKFDKITSYVSYKVPIIDTTPEILIWREKTYKLSSSFREFKLDSKTEFKEAYPDRFYIIKCDDDVKIKLFLLHSIFYQLDSLHHKDNKLYIGLDFEFNERKIALAQISFNQLRRHKYIFVLDPNLLTEYQINLMIKTIFTSNIQRIVHGSDSLDIPYIFENLFANDKDKIIKFVRTTIDTRFICEYYKVTSQFTDKKCSIYDALLFFKTITQKKYDDLIKNNSIMGPVQDINWNVKNMSSFHLKYAAYDVLFLRRFLSDMHKMAKKIGNIDRTMAYITTITKFTFLEKYNVISIIPETKLIVDKINNYIIKIGEKNHTLISIYNDVITNMILPGLELRIADILNINYFKGYLTFIFKRIIYSILSDRYTIYINKSDKYNEKITFKDIYPILSKADLGKFISLLEKIYQHAKVEIIRIL